MRRKSCYLAAAILILKQDTFNLDCPIFLGKHSKWMICCRLLRGWKWSRIRQGNKSPKMLDFLMQNSKHLPVCFCLCFVSLSSHLQLTFTGFFHKDGECLGLCILFWVMFTFKCVRYLNSVSLMNIVTDRTDGDILCVAVFKLRWEWRFFFNVNQHQCCWHTNIVLKIWSQNLVAVVTLGPYNTWKI